MTTTKKPDGYCAWHPEKGWKRQSFETLPRHGAGFEHGWQIKPVCLITPERLEELEGIEKWARDNYRSLLDIVNTDSPEFKLLARLLFPEDK